MMIDKQEQKKSKIHLGIIGSADFCRRVNAVVAAVLLVLWSQFLIVVAILVAVMTGIENVYTLDEFSAQGPDPDPK